MKKSYKIWLTIFLALLILFWTPFIFIKFGQRSNIIKTIEELPKADAVIVFGAHLTSEGEPTPLLQERLEAGVQIFEAGRAEKIVASNTQKAAKVMVNYLENQGIPPEAIELDPDAVGTGDSCRYELRQHGRDRELIFVSNGFHLARLLYLCQREEIEGVAFPAESIEFIDRSQYSTWIKFSVRTRRQVREAALDWLAVLRMI